MATLLEIKSSLFTDGQSSRLADRYVERWRAANPDGTVIVRDFARDPVPHLSADAFAGFAADPAARTPAQAEAVAFSDSLIEELARADVVALGLPMYNFGIPSSLKAYFDHVARSGITFRYTAEGPEGLMTGKQVRVFAARGGMYSGTPRDTQTTYVRNFLGFLGMQDVAFVYAEGLAMGDEPRDQALTTANEALDRLAV